MLDASSSLNQKSVNTLLPLQLSSLSYSVGDTCLLNDLNVTIDSPGITAIMGPNGAGKSLFLRMIHGLISPTIGEVRWQGNALDLSIRRQQALVFQKPVLMRRSVAANIDFVLKSRVSDYRQRREQVLQQAGLSGQRDQPARLLSGGEQQKLALVRALALGPRVLLLDEPCASIDSAASLQIENLLRLTRQQAVKIILVTHDIGQARRLADDVVFMHNGKLLEYAPAEHFFSSPGSTQAEAYIDGRIHL